MQLVKGEREGQWFARFPRNDRLCCSYEEHVLLGNLGNIDWRPCLNLWAVVQYVTKYATKAPKGSRRLNEVLKDAVDEVCRYVAEGEGADFLRRCIQKFFARMLGERDFHAYEALQLGLQLPTVIPLMPVVSLNTSGARPLKLQCKELGQAGPETPVHWDSRVDKFNKRLQLVRRGHGKDLQKCEALARQTRDVSLFEFYWKYSVFKGKISPGGRSVCIMVTPGYGADVANVEHACHEAYARSAVIAYWRHMATERRHDALQREMAKSQRPLCAHDRILWGATPFRDPLPHALAPEEDAYLGTRDLYMKFEGPAHGWALALLEMLVDPMLKTWVPGWVVEQYERGNPYFKDVLTGLQLRDYKTNRAFLRKVRKEMIWRHQRRLR